MPVKKRKNAMQKTRNRFVFLFLIVFVTLLVTEWAIYLQQSRQATDTAIVDAAGRNRMLSQRIAFLSQQLVRGQEDGPARTFLEEAIVLHDVSLRALIHGGIAPGIGGDRILPAAPPDILVAAQHAEELWLQYRNNAAIIASGSFSPDGAIDMQVSDALAFIEENALTMLVRNDALVKEYVNANQSKQQRLNRTMLVFLLLKVAVVFGVYLKARSISFRLVHEVEDKGVVLDELSSSQHLLRSKTDGLERQKLAMLNIMEDLEEEKQKLIQREQELAEAQQIGKFGSFAWNLKTNVVQWSDESFRIHGLEPSDDHVPPPIEDYYKIIHLDDLKEAKASIAKALKTIKDNEYVYRVVLANQQVRYVRVISKLTRDKKGKPELLNGTFQDVTKEREVDQAKTEFVSLASHQLRTPLSAINWYSEMLLAGDAGKINKEQTKYVNEIYNGNQRMVDLVNALLNVSRIELGTFSVEPESVRFEDLVDSVVTELQSDIKRKKQIVSLKFAKGLPKMDADPKLLRMVVQNLMSNAIKYTPEKGTIELKADKARGGKRIEFSVVDTGMGIPKQQQEQIFTKMFRADNAKESDTDGTGLGLYIIKSVVERCGGSIRFKSIEGEGTTFYVVLPIKMKIKKGARPLEIG